MVSGVCVSSRCVWHLVRKVRWGMQPVGRSFVVSEDVGRGS